MNIKTTCSSTLRPWREKVAAGRMRGYKNRHAELVSASQHCFPLPWRERMPAGQVRGYSLGFTLMEMLVVVLIIGILGAIMLPQYQRAVLKSRYAGLMPIAKAMADSNEAYFLEHGNYADNAQDLPVQGRQNYPDGTELEFGTSTEYSYVLATRGDDFPNNYIVYQKHSEQYPGEIHCEALKNDTLAEGVCQSFGATQNIGTTLTSTHDTWLLSGTGNGEPPLKTCAGNAPSQEIDCPSGCGQVTVTAACNTKTGQWDYSNADTSACPDQPNDQTASCGSGYTGNKTRSATCNSAGTAWEFTEDNWDTSSCKKVYNKECKTFFTDDSDCSNASFTANRCIALQDHSGCNNNTYSGTATCENNNASGCNDSEFSGSSHCVGSNGGNPGTTGCTGNTFSDSSYCQGRGKSNNTIVGGAACTNNIFNTGTYCTADNGIGGCSNNTFNSGSYCNGKVCFSCDETSKGCVGNTFNSGSYCDGTKSGGMCLGNTYKSGSYCKAGYSGNCTGEYEEGSWCEGSYCPDGSPTSTAGQCWNGHGGTKAC